MIAPLLVRPITCWAFFVFRAGAMFCLLASSTCICHHTVHSIYRTSCMHRLHYSRIAAQRMPAEDQWKMIRLYYRINSMSLPKSTVIQGNNERIYVICHVLMFAQISNGHDANWGITDLLDQELSQNLTCSDMFNNKNKFFFCVIGTFHLPSFFRTT